MSKQETSDLIFPLVRLFLRPILLIILSLSGAFMGSYLWLPAWYGWLLLLFGFVGFIVLLFLLYHVYLFMTFRGPYRQSSGD